MRGEHHFGSRVWYDRNAILIQDLGEDLTFAHQWDAGQAPAVVPQNRTIGNIGCLQNGDDATDQLDSNQVFDGFPLECFVPDPKPLEDWSKASSYNTCSLQRFYAFVISKLYDDDPATITTAFGLLLGADYVVKVRRQAGVFPAMVTVVGNGNFFCVLDGTRTPQQFALQALYSLEGPENFGTWGTSRFWFVASQYVLQNCNDDGLLAGQRFFITGHSYGAAVACVLAARLHDYNAFAAIRYLSFACPKIGDERIVASLSATEGLNLANTNDIITVLPPDLVQLRPVAAFLGVFSLFVWDEWFRPPNQFGLREDGTGGFNLFPLLDFTTLLQIAEDVLAQAPAPVVTGHLIATYIARLQLRCPTTLWPLTPALNALISNRDKMLLEGGAKMLLEGGANMLLEN